MGTLISFPTTECPRCRASMFEGKVILTGYRRGKKGAMAHYACACCDKNFKVYYPGATWEVFEGAKKLYANAMGPKGGGAA